MNDVTVEKTEKQPAALPAEERRRLYNETVRKANLVNIFLSSVKFDVDRDALLRLPKPALVFGHTVERFAYNSDKGGCLITVKWRVDMKESKKSVVKCSASYDIAYDGLATSNEVILKIFAENIAAAVTYPYFRSLFATLDWGANLRTPPLPVLKLFPKV